MQVREGERGGRGREGDGRREDGRVRKGGRMGG